MLAYHDGLEKGECTRDKDGNELMTDQDQGKAAEAKLRELYGKKDNLGEWIFLTIQSATMSP
jgi:hypothetical protein